MHGVIYNPSMILISQELGLSHVGLEHIDVGGFCGLKNVSTLLMSRNHLTSPPPLCPLKCSLEKLHLSSNSIAQFNKDFLMGFRKLEDIILSRNQLIQLPDLHWVHDTLHSISASKNNIQSLDAFRTDAPFKYLNYIDMGNNNIRTFDHTILRHLPQLRNLYIHGNKLTHVEDFRSYYMGIINLGANPWHCDGKLSWMGEEDMDFEEFLTCASPSCVEGTAIASMSKQNTPV